MTTYREVLGMPEVPDDYEPPAKHCPSRARHWRIIPGTVGVRAPVCTTCGSPNPKPLTEQEWAELMSWVRDGWGVGKFVRKAIRDREAAKASPEG